MSSEITSSVSQENSDKFTDDSNALDSFNISQESDSNTNSNFDSRSGSFDFDTLKNYNAKIAGDKFNLPQQELTYEKPVYRQGFIELLINTKDAIFGILDDILNGNISPGILFKQNRLFYVGIVMFVIILGMYLFEFIVKLNENKQKSSVPNSPVQQIVHHIITTDAPNTGNIIDSKIIDPTTIVQAHINSPQN